jgi:PAS domain S-box-containing protein
MDKTPRLDVGFFRSAIESSMDCVRVLDRQGRVLFVNRAGLAGLEIDNFSPAQEWRSFWPEPGRIEVERGLDAALRGESYRFEGECPTARGSMRWWDVAIAPIFNDAGEVAALIATSRDITTEKQARADSADVVLNLARSTASMRSAFRIARVGGWEIDFVGRRCLFSPELFELMGVSAELDMSLAESVLFWTEEDRAPFQACLDRVERTGERLRFEGRSAGRQSGALWWRLFGEPVLDEGRCIALRGAAQDVTELRLTLEREQKALRDAEEMSGFLATISHEIRTPLNGVLGMAQVMGRGELSQIQRERLGVIEASGAVLLSLLNDVLDLSRAESGKIELQSDVFDIQVLANDALALLTSLLKGKPVSIQVSVAPSAAGFWAGDPKRVGQVLRNLVGNAAKFTDRGSVVLDISSEGEGLIIRVADTGIGIPADRLEHIFDRFVQVDAATTRRFGGSGLGLAICRDLVRLMNGEIRVESRLDAGAEFVVSLPLERRQTRDKAELAESDVDLSEAHESLRVLAAEDNATNQLVLKTLLREVGIEPHIVWNGQEVVEAWRDGQWDIVLMDIQMPGMDGLEATRVIRAIERREGRKRTPIIALTANAMAQHKANYLKAGMDALVAKPINFAWLLDAMNSALGLDEVDSAERESGTNERSEA